MRVGVVNFDPGRLAFFPSNPLIPSFVRSSVHSLLVCCSWLHHDRYARHRQYSDRLSTRKPSSSVGPSPSTENISVASDRQ